MRLSYIIFAVLGLMSIVAFCAFGIDKYKARQGGWRIPEKTFLLANRKAAREEELERHE